MYVHVHGHVYVCTCTYRLHVCINVFVCTYSIYVHECTCTCIYLYYNIILYLGEDSMELETLEGQFRAVMDKSRHKKKQLRQLETDILVLKNNYN